ncbi:hypothetical protein [Photobacterium sp. Hal280]|uniref:hypothetical protein n=1 Tax=Photobacterium sp. Hal280 TaxID=3035163 RepID=UPI00301C31BD
MENRLQNDARLVCESWQRCRDYGLESHQTPVLHLPDPSHWQQKRQLAEMMVSVTRDKVLPGFQSMLANTSSLVILTDHQGYLLERWGNPSFMQQMSPALFEPGACWQEK